jgi:hypothetical protein
MNDSWGYESNESQTGNNLDGPKALRDAYDKLKLQNESLNEKLTSFLEDQQKQKLAGVFESLGVPGAATVYQGDADPEKAKAWVESMRGVFGSGSAQGNTPTPAAPAFTQDQQAALQAVTQAGFDGVPMGNFEAAAAAVGQANSIEELIAGFQKGSGTIG